MTESEKSLLERAASGDSAAFEMLVRRQKDTLFNFALTIAGGDYAEAEDIMQDALIKAFKGISGFNGRCSFRSWLWRIMKNEFINYKRSRKTRTQLLLEDVKGVTPESKECTESEVADFQRRAGLLKLIGMLPVKHREIITLVDLQELSYEDVADFLGVTVLTARTRACRAKKKLTELALKHKNLFF